MTHTLIKRTALFVAFVLLWALLAAAVAHSAPREVVNFSGFAPGTIVVKTGERRLYYVVDRQHALRFPVGVGRKGQEWTGAARVEGKYVKPSWEPPQEIRRDHPNLPKVIPGGDGANPMGAAALTLRGGEYAIHGTNNPRSVGGFVSYGCIRMYNADIKALYRMVDIGTPVIVER
ncbi:MAG TPA: L,D-transpeptidase [Pseudolabrys sp.]|nr:L,D-transpeptidase [Pseudolabrys sp.]